MRAEGKQQPLGAKAFSPERPRPNASTTDGDEQAAVAAGDAFAAYSPVTAAAAAATAATRNQRREERGEEEVKARAANGVEMERTNARVVRGSIAMIERRLP